MAPPPRAARILVALFVGCGMLTVPRLIAQAAPHVLSVSVTDREGRPVEGLGPADFIVREDRITREVLSVAPNDEPMQIAVLIDNSQAASAFVRDYREALSALITAVTANTTPKGKHQLALIALASRPTILRDYTTDQAQLLKSAQSLFAQPDTGTYFLDGILETSAGINKRSSSRPVFVAILSEGQELSDRPYQAVLPALKSAGAALYVVKVGSPRNSSADRAKVIDQGTSQSGGRDVDILTSTALTGTLKQIADELTHEYLVTYARPQTLIPPDTVTVAVTKPGLTARGTPLKTEPRAQERR